LIENLNGDERVWSDMVKLLKLVVVKKIAWYKELQGNSASLMWAVLFNILLSGRATIGDAADSEQRGAIEENTSSAVSLLQNGAIGHPHTILVNDTKILFINRNMKERIRIEFILVFWDVAPCSLIAVGRRFRGAYCLHHCTNEVGSTHF
jgi:hypothetical protein